MILVTGGAGYIGSHCVIALLESGYDVVIFDSMEIGHRETAETLKNLDCKGKVVDVMEGDLMNIDDIDRVFETHRVDAVVHFAAYSQVAESMRDPSKYWNNNVVGTMHLLDSMRSHGVNRSTYLSTRNTPRTPSTPTEDPNWSSNR